MSPSFKGQMNQKFPMLSFKILIKSEINQKIRRLSELLVCTCAVILSVKPQVRILQEITFFLSDVEVLSLQNLHALLFFYFTSLSFDALIVTFRKYDEKRWKFIHQSACELERVEKGFGRETRVSARSVKTLIITFV